MTRVYSSSPYYDDFSVEDNYHRILFRPGRAVQARELTQIQTILQNQVEKFANYTFKNGSIITGCPPFFRFRYDYVKIRDLDSNGDGVVVSDIVEGYTLTGLSSNVTAFVTLADDGVETVTSNTKAIFLSYTSSNVTTKTFSDNEQIEVRTPTGSLVATVVSLASSSTGKGSLFTLGNGVIYVNGVFVENPYQTIILDKFGTTPSYKIGVELTETIITSDNDEGLLDPAVGSSNYFAPGGDRYKAVTTLVKKLPDEEDTEDFYLLFEVENGLEKRSFEKAQLNLLLDELAQRTYEESGNYVVKPFGVRVRQHLNTGTNGGLYLANSTPAGNINKLAIGVEPGVGYVGGYRIRNYLTEYQTVDKGIDVASEEQQPVSFGYGNYIVVEEMAGPWDVDNGTLIQLRDTAADAVTNQTYGTTAAPGTNVGNARVKSVVYESGTAGLSNAQYRVYLYDVNLTSNVSFANVRSIYYDAGSGTDSIADIVLTSNIAVLQESVFDTGVFNFPQTAIKTLRDTSGSIDNSFEFKKSFDVTIATDGTFSVTSSIANEEFPYSAGALNATQKRDGFVLVLNSAGTTNNLSGNIAVYTANTVVNGYGGTSFTTQLKSGDRFRTASGNVYRVANIASNDLLYITSNALSTEVFTDYQKQFAAGEYIDLSINGSSGTGRSVTLVTDTQVSVDIEESLSGTIDAKILCNLQRTDGQEIQKVLNKDRYVKINCNTAGTGGSYNLGFSDIFRVSAIYHGTTYATTNTDVTNEFFIDNGQRDSVYTHGRIIKKPTSTLTLTASSRLLVKLDYFTHVTSTGVGFLSVDSYPIDDTETTPNTIKTEDIPVFVSQTGAVYDLRNSIDIRPRYTDTSASSTSIGSATENPASPSALTIPSGGLRVAVPNETFLTDLDYYLSRVDLVYIDKTNLIGVIRGTPALFPNAPVQPAESMTLASVFVAPYPSLPPETARATGRFDYATNVKMVDNRRYTMRDIGAINQKLNRLEYYTALSFLEKQAQDLVVPSSITGLDRFKNGFLVDNFRGHGVGNLTDLQYSCAVDPEKGELRPKFDIDNIDLSFNSSSSTNVIRAPRDAILTVTTASGTFAANTTITQSGTTARINHVVGSKLYVDDVSGTFANATSFSASNGAAGTITAISEPTPGALVTLDYTHEVYASNPFATKPRNCVGDLLFTWLGEIELDPPADNWTDTTVNPDLVVNFDNGLDNWLALDEAWGTQWNDWETDWRGRPSNPVVISQQQVGTRASGATNNIGQAGQIQTISQTLLGTVDVRQSRSGTNLTVTPEVINYDLGNRVVDVRVIPFMRSQLITFTAKRLKPNTRVYPFFDNEAISSYCRPAGGNFGDALLTDGSGNLVGQFRIPNDSTLRFRTGTKQFKLIDDVLNRSSFQTTVAYEDFTASGITQTQETTILSSRGARVGFEREFDTRTIQEQSVTTRTTQRVVPPPPDVNLGGGDGGDGGDPIAQTFVVDRTGYGVYATKVDLYFRTKSSTLPITLQVREVVNGFPGPRILPFGSVTLTPDQINVSEDASSPTVFSFPSPVYLQEGVEYCFVLLPAGNNPDYNIWVSEIGENQLGTTNRVSAQPYIGLLFTSANDRGWTAFQAEDIKFTLYRAKFETNTTGTIIINNRNEDYLTLGSISGSINPGDNVTYSSGTGIVASYNSLYNQIVLVKNGTGRVRANVVPTGNIITTTANATVIGDGTLFTTELYANATLYSANTNTRIGRVLSIADDTTLTLEASSAENVLNEAFLVFDEVFNTANANNRARVETIDSKFVTLFDTNLNYISFYSTEEDWQYRARDNGTNTVSGYIDFTANENTELPAVVRIDSNTNEDISYSNTKSLVYKSEISTTSDYVSPALDIAKMSSIIVYNRINNDSTDETTNNGAALARYISKLVVLDDDQDAEDLKVYLTAYKPASTDIKVYAKLINALDGTNPSEASYIELERVTSSVVLSDGKFQNDFLEYEYKLPDSVLTGPNGEVQYTSGGNTYTSYKSFAIKIVLLSSNRAVVPRVKDYRAICLQI